MFMFKKQFNKKHMINKQRNIKVKRNVFCFFYTYKLSFTAEYVSDRVRSQIYIFPYSICLWSPKSSWDWIFSGKVESKHALVQTKMKKKSSVWRISLENNIFLLFPAILSTYKSTHLSIQNKCITIFETLMLFNLF